MAHTNSINKIMDYLKDKKEPVTISDVSLNVHLAPKSVLQVLKILEQFHKIRFITNGKTTFIIKGEENEITTI